MATRKPAQSSNPEENYRHVRRHYHGRLSGIGGGVFFVLLGII